MPAITKVHVSTRHERAAVVEIVEISPSGEKSAVTETVCVSIPHKKPTPAVIDTCQMPDATMSVSTIQAVVKQVQIRILVKSQQ